MYQDARAVFKVLFLKDIIVLESIVRSLIFTLIVKVVEKDLKKLMENVLFKVKDFAQRVNNLIQLDFYANLSKQETVLMLILKIQKNAINVKTDFF